MNIIDFKNNVRRESFRSGRKFDSFVTQVSPFLTFVFAKTPISANQVSFIMLLCGICSGICFVLEQMILGVILMQVWYILDCVDGEIARYKNQCSITGLYYDHLIHYLNHPIFFITISYALYMQSSIEWLLICGLLGALFDLIDRASNDTYMMVLYQNMLKNEIKISESNIIPCRSNKFRRKVVDLLHFPAIMNMFTVSIVLDYSLIALGLVNNYYVTTIVIIVYGVLIPIYSSLKMYYNVKTFRLDKELVERMQK